MKNKTENPLPKMLPGTVHEQYVRCGKENCKCARGELHGAYYYHFVRVNGKLRKRYVPREQAAEMRLACQTRQEEERERREMLRESLRSIRELNEEFKDINASFASIIRRIYS